MPAFIKTPEDEKNWQKAKDIVKKEYNYSENDDNFWKLTNSIYQKIKTSHILAHDLIKLAKTLMADDSSYPVGLSEKSKPFYDKLKKGIAEKSIFNTDYLSIKERLSRNLEELSPDDPKVGSFIYQSTDSFLSFTSMKKYLREIKAVIQKNDKTRITEMSNRAQTSEKYQNILDNWDDVVAKTSKFLNEVETWLPVGEMLVEAKNYIVKGRKPIERPEGYISPVYVPPFAGAAAQKLVSDKLMEIVDEKKETFFNAIKDMVLKAVESYSGDYTFKSIKSHLLDKRCMQYFYIVYQTNTSLPNTYKLRDDYKERADAAVKQMIEAIIKSYVAKNVGKIAPIIHAKGEPSSSKVVAGKLKGWGFDGTINFEFADGTRFDVNNQVVLSVSYSGTWFERFPTTFHNVKFKNGKIQAMVSEKDMNEIWAKEV